IKDGAIEVNNYPLPETVEAYELPSVRYWPAETWVDERGFSVAEAGGKVSRGASD
ncbi:MAG: hypothetical protein HYV26_17845, partial [Candidatus Hydrogenedentes bacterium]|nr:hypothetical protein [Candidatus Hydrogenedentota bacterium]